MSESILAAMTTAFSGEEAAFEWKLLYRFFGLLVQTGTPVSLDTLAQALACERAQVVRVRGSSSILKPSTMRAATCSGWA